MVQVERDHSQIQMRHYSGIRLQTDKQHADNFIASPVNCRYPYAASSGFRRRY